MGSAGNDLARGVLRYWGWIALAVIALRLGQGQLDGVSLFLAVASILYFSFSVPVWCGAITREDELCRNNAAGLLMGCHLREHRFQKLKLAVVPRSWRALMRRVWDNPLPTAGAVLSGALLVVATAATVVQAVAAVLWHG